MKGRVVAQRFYSPGFARLPWGGVFRADIQIGMVLVDYGEYLQAYVGFGFGLSEQADVDDIAQWGAKLEPEVARAVWPRETRGVVFKEEIAP